MTFPNAIVFFLLGLLMHAMPHLMPSLVAQPNAIYTESDSALWLMFMSWVLRGVGGWYALRCMFELSWSAAERMLASWAGAREAAVSAPATHPELAKF